MSAIANRDQWLRSKAPPSVGQATLVCTVSVTPVWMDGRSPDAGGKLSVNAVRYQITDTGSSLERDGRKGVCYQLVADGCRNWLTHSPFSCTAHAVYRHIHVSSLLPQWQDTQNAIVWPSGGNHPEFSNDHDQSCFWSYMIADDLIAIKSWSRQAFMSFHSVFFSRNMAASKPIFDCNFFAFLGRFL